MPKEEKLSEQETRDRFLPRVVEIIRESQRTEYEKSSGLSDSGVKWFKGHYLIAQWSKGANKLVYFSPLDTLENKKVEYTGVQLQEILTAVGETTDGKKSPDG